MDLSGPNPPLSDPGKLWRRPRGQYCVAAIVLFMTMNVFAEKPLSLWIPWLWAVSPWLGQQVLQYLEGEGREVFDLLVTAGWCLGQPVRDPKEGWQVGVFVHGLSGAIMISNKKPLSSRHTNI